MCHVFPALWVHITDQSVCILEKTEANQALMDLFTANCFYDN